jgi:hypothetical protein
LHKAMDYYDDAPIMTIHVYTDFKLR